MKNGKLSCSDCRHFNGIDGINEVWVDCQLFGTFKDTKTKEECNRFYYNYPKEHIDVLLKFFQKWFNSQKVSFDTADDIGDSEKAMMITDKDIKDFLSRW